MSDSPGVPASDDEREQLAQQLDGVYAGAWTVER